MAITIADSPYILQNKNSFLNCFRRWRLRHPMENLIPIVVKFPADWLLQINFAQVRLFWAILDQPKVREMYWKGPRESPEMWINYLHNNPNRIEAKVGKGNWKIVPSKVIENAKELKPTPGDGTDIEGFGSICVYLPIERDSVYFQYKTTNFVIIINFLIKLN